MREQRLIVVGVVLLASLGSLSSAGAAEPNTSSASSAGSATESSTAAVDFAHGTVYVGPAITPFNVEGLADIDASDWQNFGLGSSEGRVSIPMGSGNGGGVRIGGRLGYEVDVIGIPALAEVGFFPGKVQVISLALGVNWKPVKGSWGFIGLSPRVGYIMGQMDFGNVHVYPGKTPPVVTPIGTFNEGDPLKASVGGPMVAATVTAGFNFTDHIGMRIDAGVQAAFLSELIVKGGDVELKKDAPSLVKNDGTSTQAGLNPKASSFGPVALVGVSYRF